MIDLGQVHTVEQHISDAEHIGELLLLNAKDGAAEGLLILHGGDVLLQGLQPAGQKAAGAAGKVRHAFPDLGPDHLGHKVRHGPGRIELTGGAGALQLLQNGLVDLSEGVALLVVPQIQIVDHVQHLAQQDAVLHVVVCVLEGGADDGLFDGRLRGDGHTGDYIPGGVLRVVALEHGEQHVIDELQQRIAGHGGAAAVVHCPVAPAAGLGDDGGVVVLLQFPVLLLGVVDLQKQHPGNLLDPLGVAVDARVVAHDVPQAFDKGG